MACMRLGTNLMVRGLRLMVHLGCGAEERRNPQPVDLDLALKFTRPPSGCESDELEDTVCYGELSERLAAYCEGKQFKLVESLAAQLFRVAKETTNVKFRDAVLSLRVTKLHPPVANLNGGVTFTIGDWDATW